MFISNRNQLLGASLIIALFIIYTFNTYRLDTRQHLPNLSFSIDHFSSMQNNTSTLEINTQATNHSHALEHSNEDGQVDWSRFAYTQYATNTDYLCNSVMLFSILHTLGSKADRLLMFPEDFDPENPRTDPNTLESQLLFKARGLYGVKLQPVKLQSRYESSDITWAQSYTKLLAFNQTQYSRVLSLDSDSTVLQPMDELFLLPSAPVAMPRAYWIDPAPHLVLSSQIVLIEPSTKEFARIMDAIHSASTNDYDMEIVNNLYRFSAMVIPHRPYDLLTGEFRSKNHERYMGEVDEWNAESVLKEAKFLHFSDWPTPKPWLADRVALEEGKPECIKVSGGNATDCSNQKAWLEFYADFARRRKEVCGIEIAHDPEKESSNELSRRATVRSPWEPVFE